METLKQVWPQLAYLGMVLIGLSVIWSERGTPRTGYHTFLPDFLIVLVFLFLLYMGGFFDPLIAMFY